MCRRWLDSEPCMNYRCRNNLFWEDLELNREKIRMTDKALGIRNCRCLIINPWTSEEVSNAWGLTREEIKRSEEEAFKKLQKKLRNNRKRSQSTTTVIRKNQDIFFIKTVLEKKEKENKNFSAIRWLSENEQVNLF